MNRIRPTINRLVQPRLAFLGLLAALLCAAPAFGQLEITNPSPIPPVTQGGFVFLPLETNYSLQFQTLSSWSVVSGSLPPGITIVDSQFGSYLWGEALQAGLYTFTLEAYDEEFDQEATKQFQWRINQPLAILPPFTLPDASVGANYGFRKFASGGTPPVYWYISEQYGLPENGGEGANQEFKMEAVPEGLSMSQDGLLSGTIQPPPGDFEFGVVVNDEGLGSDFEVLSLRVNPAPQILSGPQLPSGAVGQPYQYDIKVGGGTPPFNFQITGGLLPPGLTLSAAGKITGVPQQPGTFPLLVLLRDSGGGPLGTGAFTSQAFQLTIVSAPVITTVSPLPPALLGQSYSQTLSAAGGVSPYLWSVPGGGLPPGVTMSQAGVLSGTPSTPGAYQFTVQLVDSVGTPAAKAFSLTVGSAVQITTASPLPPGTTGQAYAASLAATGGTPPYTWSIASGALPPGLTLAGSTISGAPTQAGVFSFQVNAVAQAGGSASKSFQISVASALTITSTSPLPAGSTGSAYSLALQAAGGTPPYLWQVVSGSLPAGVSLSAGGALSGVPAAGGTFNFTVEVRDSASAVQRAFSLTVGQPLSMLTSFLPQGTAGLGYTTALEAQGGTPPYQWSVLSGPLPSGLALSPGGQIGGTPFGPAFAVITIEVRDSANATATRQFELRVLAETLEVDSPGVLPQAVLGQPYRFQLQARGGAPPYRWFVSGGSLPPGIRLSEGGLLSGTPDTPGTYDVSITLEDSGGAFAAAEVKESQERHAAAGFAFRLVVAFPPLQVTTSNLPEAAVGAAYSASLAATGGRPTRFWAVVNGSLPPGLSLGEATGEIAGTPTSTGRFPFTVQVRDNVGPAATRALAIDVLSTATLLLSQNELQFSAAVGGSRPAIQTIGVVSSRNDLLNFIVQEPANAPWLFVRPNRGVTPGRIDVGVDSTILPAGEHEAQFRVLSPATAQQIVVAVKVAIADLPPSLGVSPTLIRSGRRGGEAEVEQYRIAVGNRGGGGPIDFTAGVPGNVRWLSVEPASGVAFPGRPVFLRATIDPAGLRPGFHRAAVRVASEAGTEEVAVNYFVPGEGGIIRLVPAGVFVESRRLNGVSRNTRTFAIQNPGNTPFDWTARILGAVSWLSLGQAEGAVGAGEIAEVPVTLDSEGLEPGAYYARIRVESSGARNSPQDFLVVLEVTAEDAAPRPNPSPAGLVFVSTEGGPNPGSQQVELFTSSATPVAYQASTTGEEWLAVSPRTGSTSTATPAKLDVSIATKDLKPGVYRAGVNVALSSTLVRTVNVTLLVQAAPGANVARSERTADCTPSRLVLAQTGLVNRFNAPVAWPVPLVVRVLNDCGNPVRDSRVVASFSNGDPALVMPLLNPVNGTYAATWTPSRPTGEAEITTTASSVALEPDSITTNGAVPQGSAPVVDEAGALHSFFPQSGAPLAPGTLVQILGSGLSTVTIETDPSQPPFEAGGSAVLIGGIPAPLLYVSPTQINTQVPTELPPDVPHQMIVAATGAISVPQPVFVSPVGPGVATTDGFAAARHADGRVVTVDDPALPGDRISIFAAGMGLTDIPVATGQPGPEDPFARVLTDPVVRVGGRTAEVSFAGLSPGLVGVYRVDFLVPEGLDPGEYDVVVQQDEAAANPVKLPVGAP
ncbi:MAG: putative Ig domain-containing protein [Bryobacterales bacterium]|nr:putative Ig domain-containing protein [Bryobacterales bacterium]